MASSYPSGLDDFTAIGPSDEMDTVVGGRTHRAMHNDANDAIEAVEAELGIDPAGESATVVARLNAADSAVAGKADTDSLGGAALLDVGTVADTVAAGDDSRLTDQRTPTDDSVTSAKIVNGAIVDGDINASAGIAQSKVANLTTDIAALLVKASNLSDLTNAGTARDNLGLGTMAVAATSAYAALAGATFTGAVMVDGTADVIQTRVQGHTGQSAALQTWESSAAAVLASVSAAGLGTFSDLRITEYNSGNVRLGQSALASLGAATANIAIGFSASSSITGGNGGNTAVGFGTNRYNVTGHSGTFLGLYAGQGVAANSHTENTAVGVWSLGSVSAGSNNIALGAWSGRYLTSQSNELFINSLGRTDRAGDIALSIVYGQQAAAAADQVLQFNSSVAIGGAASLGGGKLVTFMANANTVPTSNPVGGGILYVTGGALTYRGSSGTITTIAAA